MHHRLRFRCGQPVELAGVAVSDEDVYARSDRPIDDRFQTIRRNLIPVVKRGDQNARDAGQRLPELRIDGDHGMLSLPVALACAAGTASVDFRLRYAAAA